MGHLLLTSSKSHQMNGHGFPHRLSLQDAEKSFELWSCTVIVRHWRRLERGLKIVYYGRAILSDLEADV